jgi:glutamate-ammonia-ligase adenylyltransferase
MIDAGKKQRIESLCADVERHGLKDFFARMDEDYFDTFPPEEIAAHIRMSAQLDSRHRLRIAVTPAAAPNEFDIVIVGFDYLSEFSIFCGVMSAFGLDIRAGDIYSFSRHASARKIVDVFHVGVKRGETFDEDEQREFEQELQTLANLLAAGSPDQARERLNRFVTERIESMNEELSGLLSPIEIDFDNKLSAEWTVMEARSDDAFAFLYAVSNALAMQDIYIHKVKIRSVARQARDLFFIANRWGRKIENPQEQETLRTAVAMIKQFTRFLPQAPDPGKAMRHFDQFLDKLADDESADRIMTFLSHEEGMNALAHLLGSSDFLWEEFLSVHFRELLPVLEDIKSVGHEEFLDLPGDGASFDEKKRALNQFKDTQLFLVEVKHLLDPQFGLLEFSEALTSLAESVVDAAAKICYEELGGRHGPYAICGLGKFGGREMGYASDLELLFVHDTPGSTPFFESFVRKVTDVIEARQKGIFQIDLRLRPYGEKGALSVPFEQLTKYYSPNGPAAPFERQSLIKLRWVAGDEGLGRRVESLRDEFTYSGLPWDWENALHLRKRQIRELVKAGDINVKYGRGGIIDIEYAVQYLQLLHGKDHRELRVPNTLQALDQLRRLNIIPEREYEVLRSAYLFLRKLIDAQRIVRGDASDLVLPEESSDEFKSLARRLGYPEQDRRKAATLLAEEIRTTMQDVSGYFQSRFSSRAG